MDKQYLDCDIADGGEPPFEVSLSVDSRVVSANHSGLVTIDAGYKSLSTDGGVAVVQRGAPETAFFAFMGDEHAALIAPDTRQESQPGAPVSLTPPPCDPTVTTSDLYHAFSVE